VRVERALARGVTVVSRIGAQRADQEKRKFRYSLHDSPSLRDVEKKWSIEPAKEVWIDLVGSYEKCGRSRAADFTAARDDGNCR
jgi:hypothetical protein